MSGPRALIGLRHEPHRTPLKFEEPDYEEKPEGAAPATGRLSRVSPNALQAISGSEERTEDEPPDHAYYHESSTCPGRISSGNSDNSAQLVQAD
jgi:hypothetical protein